VACHGGGLTGGTMANPTWALDTGLGCGSCHGAPPAELPNNGGPHSLSPQCQLCHLVETGTGAPFPPPDNAHHGDGAVTVLDRVNVPNCEGCHTGTTVPFAPPFRDTNGDTDPADPQVGAHAGHLTPSFITAGVTCAGCHAVPATVGDHAHVDPNAGAEVVFGAVAASHGLQPTYDATARTCTNTWCHGAGIPGGQTVSPAWTDVVNLGCTSCHPAPPNTPEHQVPGGGLVTTCGTAGGGCHARVIDVNFNWTNQSLHVNGQVDVGD
jgi:predicted CxxxxCH...CXXCH cytochrome family protein